DRLIRGDTKGRLHMGQGHVDNGAVENLEDCGHHDRQHHAPFDGGHIRHFFDPAVASRPDVSTVTTVDAPERSCMAASPGRSSKTMRTGNRCVTFTQLPLAFSGGKSEKLAPDPAPMLATCPFRVRPGYMSM